jgi:VWFA-related protein
MLRKFAVVLGFVFIALPAFSSRRLTLDQLREVLSASRNKSDSVLAWQIASLEMGQRISATQLADFEMELPGDQSRRALLALADESQFLDPPPAELPSLPPPSPEQAHKILSTIVTYVTDVIPRLPDFVATRVTLHFVDNPSTYDVNGNIATRYLPLHAVSQTSRTVTYRNGLEVTAGDASQTEQPSPGLASWGEFGPILSEVLLDAAKGQITWSHWEQGGGGPIAVFSFSVPKKDSHYEVRYCCFEDSEHTHLRNFERIPAYEGEIAADAATGAIEWLRLEAKLKRDGLVTEAKIVVLYGSVEIGGKTYICPVKSLALSKAPMVVRSSAFSQITGPRGSLGGMVATDYGAVQPGSNVVDQQQLLLNDVTFTDYHIYRTEAKIVSAKDMGAIEASASASTSETTAAPPSAPPASPAPSTTAMGNGEPAPAAAAVATAHPVAVPVPMPAPDAPEFAVAPLKELQNAPSASPDGSTSPAFTLHTTVRLVDVSVLVYDRKGRPIADLKQADFHILDNGRLQTIRYFSQAEAGAAAQDNLAHSPSKAPTPQAPPVEVQPVFSNLVTPSEAQPTVQASTILLIDSGALDFADLSWAREEVKRFLKSALPDERVGLYILKSDGYQVLTEPTTDHAQVAELLNRWKPSAPDLAKAQEAEQRNRQQIDEVHKPSDLFRTNGNTDPEDPDAGTTPEDPQLRDFGSVPALDSMAGLMGVARHLAPIAGHKSLVWVSSDNVLADWTNSTGGNPTITTAINRYSLRAQEALNDANVTLYPLDASQLETGAIDASLQHRNVELNQAARDNTSLGGGNAGLSGGGAASGEDASLNRNMAPGRIKAQMQQDLHPIQPAMQQLAIATGGRALRRAGDMSRELEGIAADGRAVYMLSFTPDVPPDNKYHHLVVKVLGHRDVKARYRTGYMYPIEPGTLKDRFQRALWKDLDSIGVSIIATPLEGDNGPQLRLNIAATGLDFAQKDGRFVDQLDFFFMQRDDSLLHAHIAGQSLHLNLKPGTYQEVLKDGLPFKQNLVLRPNLGSLRVLVVDENSGRIGSLTIPGSALQ